MGGWVAAALVSLGIVATLLGGATTTTTEFVNTPESKRGLELIEDTPLVDAAFDEAVVVRSEGLTVDAIAFRAEVRRLSAALGRLGAGTVASVVDYTTAPGAGLVSADRHAALIGVFLGPGDDIDVGPVIEVVTALDGRRGFAASVSGARSLDADFRAVAQSDLKKGEFQIGLPVAVAVLVVVFGALVASLLPALLALMSIAVGLAIVALIGQVWELSFFVTNMLVTMGLAVGIDYSLFIVSRFREERAGGRDVPEAIAVTGATASMAVLFSGATVVIALIGMLAIPTTIFISLGAGAIIVVLISVAQALTLLPAVLSLVGDRVDALRLPLPRRPVGRGLWAGLALVVIRRPVVSLLAASALLLAAAAPVLTIQTGFNGVAALPDSFVSKRGFSALERDFDAGRNTPAYVVVAGNLDDPAVGAAVERLSAAIAADPGFGPPVLDVADGRRLSQLRAPLVAPGQSATSYEAIRRLRADIVPAALGPAPAEVYVTGISAGDVDFLELTDRFFPFVVAAVLILSFALLTLAFRSIVVPLKAIVMNLLSVLAAYGLTVAVFQHGIGNELLGFQRAETIEPWIPLFLFSLLFGLSMDYQVFLVSRIQERYRQGASNRAAVAFGVSSTAGLITGAALIMVAVFGGFALGELVMFQQMGFGLAVAVLLDATIVRSVLVPAAMTLLDRRNWYFPGFLGWLPDLRVVPPAPGRSR